MKLLTPSLLAALVALTVLGLSPWSKAFAQSALVVQPTELVFSAIQGGTCGAPQNVVIAASGGGVVPFEITSSASWLSIDEAEGVTSAEVTTTVSCAGLSAGVHEATLTVQASGSSITIPTKLIVNPAGRVSLSPWKDGHRGAFSVSTDDSYPAGFDELETAGLKGTFVMNGTEPPSYYSDIFAAGSELGSHLVSHPCFEVPEATLRAEIENNMAGVQLATGSLDDVITLVWPCGFNTLAAQTVAAEYFLSARGYNINALEEPTPANFMNLKSFNSHEHTPFPPSDLKTIVDAAETQGKWANLVLHAYTNDDGAIAYAKRKDVWTAPIGTVVKYIVQRDRTVIQNYSETGSTISFSFSRLPVASTVRRNFESSIKPTDEVTFRVNLSGLAYVNEVTVGGSSVPFRVKTEGGNRVLYFSSEVSAGVRTAVVSLSSVVPPVLQVSKASLEFIVSAGGSAPAQTLQVQNAGGGSLAWNATVGGSGPQWLSVSPASGSGNQTLNVSINAAGLSEGTYTRTITITASGAVDSPRTVPVILIVPPAGADTYVLRYPNRASLLADGWSFEARTASGSVRDTEHTTGASVVYSSAGSLRVSTDVGDLWEGINNTRNSLFRDLPSNWTLVQARIDFAPTRGYQQAGLLVYGDDDNYLQVTRIFEGSQRMVFARETGGVGSLVGSVAESATKNLYMRLARNPATGVVTGSYSLNGTSWTTLGSVNQTISNPRLALVATGLDPGQILSSTGAPPDGYPDATFHIVHVVADAAPTTPVLSVSPASLGFSATAGSTTSSSQAVAITNSGAGTLQWSAAVTSGSQWLSVSPASGTGNGQVNVTVNPSGLAVGNYSGEVTISATGATSSPRVVSVALTVNPADTGGGDVTYTLNYANRASLLADGWDFLARSAGGAVRNTEQTSGATVIYSATGPLRVPADVGDLWEGINSTRNSLFHDLPAQWTSVRVRLDFAPTQNYQQAGLVIYGNDDNYVELTRVYNEGQRISFVRETGGNASVLSSATVTATTNMVLRLDRNVATNTITAFYSLNGGSTWQSMGNVTQVISNPRVGLIATASPSGFPQAAFHEVQVFSNAGSGTPVLSLSDTSLNFVAEADQPALPQTLAVQNDGGGTLSWTATVGGSGPAWLSVSPTSGNGNGTITVNANAAGLSVGTYSRTITIAAAGASGSPQTVDVTLIVTPPASSGVLTYQMNYPDATSLRADGWDFAARTASGAIRDTEQTSGTVVVYDASGPLTVPAGEGDLWQGLNNTRNTLFRDLPSNWTSVRVKLDFAPTQNYQQAGVMIYRDDDNYVQVLRSYEDGQYMTFVREIGGSAAVLAAPSVSATTNMFLRIDRNVSTGALTGMYSLDGGQSWQSLGTVTQTLTNARLGLISGGSVGSGVTPAAFHVVQVFTDSTPTLTLSTTELNLAANAGGTVPSQEIAVSTTGTSLLWTASVQGTGPNWLTVSPLAGSGAGVINVDVNAAGLAAGTYTRSIRVEAAGAANSPQTVTVRLVVTPAGTAVYQMDYPNRTSLIADGWDFLARTAAGTLRDTEQTSGAMVSYDSSGRLVIPADVGDLWEGLNNTRNSLFRDLPAQWTSVRVLLDFAPTQNTEQAGLVVYDNDDNYVHITRIFANGQMVVLAQESAGSAALFGGDSVTATENILLRLDRDLGTGVITGMYSLDGGSTWEVIGGVLKTFTNPRLGLIVGASPSSFPPAAFHRVEVWVGP